MEELSTLPEDFADADVQKLPYLANIIEETLRLHPVVPTSLPRIVPPSGATLAGYWFPGGSTVGCQSYSMHRDPTVFPDPESFIPERWDAPTKAMKETFMGFGRGSRGKIFLN
jgi:cytochrome P450